MKKLFSLTFMVVLLLLAACSGNAAGIPQTGSTATAPVAATAANPVVVPTAALTASASSPAPAATTGGAGAISCAAPAPVTTSLTEGPYWKSGSPERSSLLDAGVTGTKLVLTGYVLTTDCQPVAHALLDFWQADAQGQYDNSGYTLRGHQYTDASGRYTLETIIPGLYPGRTEHIHVKVQAPNGPVLTTQLFFPGVSQNQSDGIFDQSLVLPLEKSADGYTAAFNFVVNGQ